MRRLVIVLVAALCGWGAFPAAASANVDPAAAEREFVVSINALRTAKGLGPLAVHDELVAVARTWAATMAERDEISHNPGLADAVGADWQKLGENVGVGTTVRKLHDAFIASPAHYKNLVDPVFTHVGVGVVLGRDGAIFTTHQFMRLQPATRRPAPAARPATVTVPAAAAPAAAPAPATAAPAAPAAVAPARLVLVLQQLRELDR